MKNVRKILVIISFFAILIMFTGTVSAANWTVNPGDSIQSVINNASANDTIIVNDNNGTAYTYNEKLVINKTLQLQAKPGGNVNVHADVYDEWDGIIYVNSNGSGSTIQGFTINGDAWGIYLNSANNCLITENNMNNYGIILDYSDNNIVSGNNLTNSMIVLYDSDNNIVSGNIITAISDGIYLWGTNGTIISGNTITTNSTGSNGIYLWSTNGTKISGNTIMNTRTEFWWESGDGILVDSSNSTEISGNIIANYNNGITFYSDSGIISGNTIINNIRAGIYLAGNDIKITGNTITNNGKGIWLYGSSANINFNRIVGNEYGLYKDGTGGIVDATNNWWGSNNPIISSSSGSDIYIAGGTVNYNPWLVLNITAAPDTISTQESNITADLTHNSNGEDTSSQGHIPDNIPVNFVTNTGTVTGTVYTRNGKANATFNRGTSTSGVANITAILDNQTVQTNVTIEAIMDTTAPTVTANPAGGVYNTTQVVTLTATDNLDPNPAIYYTTNGTTPTTGSTRYTAPINIINTTTLKFMAVDAAGNQAQVQTVNYTINFITNINTGNTYSHIQDAINDPLTLNSHIIEIKNGTYTENIVLNKQLTIRPVSGGNVTVQALNPNLPVFTINTSGSSSTIKDLIINGSTSNAGIYINNSGNNTISGNTILSNRNGVYMYNSTSNLISNNTISQNTGIGVVSGYNSLNNTISGNNVTYNRWGIQIIVSFNNTIYSNTISNNGIGIYIYIPTYDSSAGNVNFNRIIQNIWGLYVEGGLVNAQNNWWGSNSLIVSFDDLSDIVIEPDCGIANYEPWLVLNINTTPSTISSQNSSQNPVITVDMTHNSAGGDTSSQGHVPDNIPVNFATNLGTITSPAYTKNGKVNTTFNRGTVTSGTANITATLDGQTVQINVTIDTVVPTVTTNLASGIYNTPKSVTLNATDNVDANPIIYYSTDNGTTWNNQAKTATLILNQGITNLMFYARDAAGNNCTTQTRNYTIDTTAPTVTANLLGGVYNTMQVVTLTATDNLDPNPAIYYTTDGTTPTTSSARYVNPINITTKTTLKFIAVDAAGNQASVQTTKFYFKIQDAIDDPSTINGSIIEVNSGTYVENIVVNKRLTIKSATGQNAIVWAANPLKSVITVNSGGNGTTIKGLTIMGATNNNDDVGDVYGILLNEASNCNITENNINNNIYGIGSLSSNNTITNNNITNNSRIGIGSYGSCNIISNNIISNNGCGIVSSSSRDTIIGNTISNNNGRIKDGIYALNSNDIISNNILAGNNVEISSVQSNNVITGNIISVNFTGIQSVSSKDNITNNIITGVDNGHYKIGIELCVSQDIITGNIITNNNDGIYSAGSSSNSNGTITIGSNNTITYNTITNNSVSGICTYDESGIIEFNRIYGNTCELENDHGTVKAINNWWGSANPTISSNNNTSDIYIVNGTVIYNPWLVLSIYNAMTKKEFTSIQSAIDDPSTSVGDTIEIGGNFIENIVINKKINIIAIHGGSATVQAPNPSKPVFTVNSGGSGSIIQGITIKGATNSYGIYLNYTNNCNITGNILTNNYYGIDLTYSNSTILSGNNVTNNLNNGIYLNYSNNNTIIGNNISNNLNNGISLYYSSANINFNRITGNTAYGLYTVGNGTINATNNWWGSNNPIISSSSPSDIYVVSGNVTYNPWLILNVSSADHAGGTSDVTADLTHNNQGEDTSPLGNVPDGIPFNFTTDFGTIETIAYTRGGKAISKLDSNSTHGVANVSAALNNQTVSKTVILLGIYNAITQKGFTSIQSAIDDSSTSAGDVIEIDNGTYNENIVVNKNLTIVSANNNNPTIGGLITINSCGSSSIIQGFTINGALNVFANNCLISRNIINCNGAYGIRASNSFNNTIYNNTITGAATVGIDTDHSSNLIIGNIIACNSNDEGIYSSYSNNTIINNIISGADESGVYSEYSNDTITSNNLTNNYYGIRTYNSTDTIKFNRIVGNTYGFRNDGGTVTAINNWWGSNSPNVSSSSPSDIYIVSGNVTYNPWIVLSMNVSSTNSGGNTSVIADLTHNNQGEDTLSQGRVPNGIPVNFTTDFGTIVSPAYTLKGQAATILNLGSTQSATVNVSASVDNQSVSTQGIITPGVAILNITSTALDNSTNQPLNITYTLPLNNSVTWLSVLWKNTGTFSNELQIIVNGTVVESKGFFNGAYYNLQNSYREAVFDTILYVNKNLPSVNSDPNIIANFWSSTAVTYNLTSTELEFVQNHRLEFIDNLTVNLAYPGVTGQNITVNDPENSSNVINLNFPGNVIHRTSQTIYVNGTYGDLSEYEGVRSFAIATTNVNDDILNYWLNQYSLYQPGAMKAAYGTFLAGLLVEYCHDQLADNVTSNFNVTWSRTSPIIVSAGDECYQTYLTLECDHSMGMTVVGMPENMVGFNFVCSSAISPIEYAVMTSLGFQFQSNSVSNGSVGSVMMDLVNAYLNNNTSVDWFIQNIYLIESANNTDFIITDLETGIVRDINTVNNYYGAYCYHSPQTDMAYYLGENLVNGARHLNIEKVVTVGFGIISVVGGVLIITGAVVAAPETGGLSLGAMFWGWSGIIGGATALGYSADDPWFYEKNNF